MIKNPELLIALIRVLTVLPLPETITTEIVIRILDTIPTVSKSDVRAFQQDVKRSGLHSATAELIVHENEICFLPLPNFNDM